MHYGKTKDAGVFGPLELYENLCIGSRNAAGSCFLREVGSQTFPGVALTEQWSVGNNTWVGTYIDHSLRVSAAELAFDWRKESPEDWINVGT